ncbi:hypothetical protein P154DRAFT_624298 [Amniculicola lignicola CBS 123094]|uniref:Uncharacterized protein n=1 Tax=Amniculicola lignicola CBS 123094 TaxID=1392246 RepID=A0A6A5W1T8_9PLEO|nr:hypothetical protein P154DRAFT_624298 [Amniculicola lignicola CBS 123094]
MQNAPKTPLTQIIPGRFSLPTALHRRGLRWYLVFPRAYGMAGGWKLFGALNDLHQQDTDADPPSSQFNLNPRFWLRDGNDWASGDGYSTINADELLNSETPFMKDSGVRRKVWIETKGKERREVEEKLVEVLLKEEELCQRCAYCGVWEYCYQDSTRHRKVGEGKDGRLVYWCGHCTRTAKVLSWNWWQSPESLADNIYFFCQLK